MFKYRVPDEIVRKLNKMESPTPNFVTSFLTENKN